MRRENKPDRLTCSLRFSAFSLIWSSRSSLASICWMLSCIVIFTTSTLSCSRKRKPAKKPRTRRIDPAGVCITGSKQSVHAPAHSHLALMVQAGIGHFEALVGRYYLYAVPRYIIVWGYWQRVPYTHTKTRIRLCTKCDWTPQTTTTPQLRLERSKWRHSCRARSNFRARQREGSFYGRCWQMLENTKPCTSVSKP